MLGGMGGYVVVGGWSGLDGDDGMWWLSSARTTSAVVPRVPALSQRKVLRLAIRGGLGVGDGVVRPLVAMGLEVLV